VKNYEKESQLNMNGSEFKKYLARNLIILLIWYELVHEFIGHEIMSWVDQLQTDAQISIL